MCGQPLVAKGEIQHSHCSEKCWWPGRGKWVIDDRELSSEIVNPKFVVYSYNEYLFNTYPVSWSSDEYTNRHISNSHGVHSLAH